MQVGVNNKSKNVSEILAGINNKAKRICDIYVGVNNKAKHVDVSQVEAGSKTFTSSTTWTSPFTGYVDVFLCNGGNGGGKGAYAIGENVSGSYGNGRAKCKGGYGGAGGVCKTFEHVPVKKGQTYNVVVGEGGKGTAQVREVNSTIRAMSSYNSTIYGGTSSFGDVVNDANPTVSPEAGATNGGKGALMEYELNSINVSTEATTGADGTADFSNVVKGSSGGGGQAYYYQGIDSSGSFHRDLPAEYGGTNAPKGGISALANTGAGGGGSKAEVYVVKTTNSDSSVSTYLLDTCYAGGNGGSGIVEIKWNAGGKLYATPSVSMLSDDDEFVEEMYINVATSLSDHEYDEMEARIMSGNYSRSQLIQEITTSTSFSRDEKRDLLALVLDYTEPDAEEGETP